MTLGRSLFWIVVVGWLGFAAASPAQDQAVSPKTKAGKIKFSERRGFRHAPFEVALSTKTPEVALYFTTDGSVPTTASNPYRGPIRVHTTTTLRAAGYRQNQLATEIDTHTYLFLSHAHKQTGAGAPPTWGTNQNELVRADYEMDPEIVGDSAYRAQFPAALEALPSLSVVMASDDLYGPAHGIYANPLRSGDEWERSTSVEFLPGDGRNGFQENCGIRIQGGWNRRPEESPKHAFRLAFRKRYGAGKLNYRLFAGPGSDEFDTLILRAGCNNSWLHWNGVERRRGDYLRDQWMRDTYAAMGQPAARGLFVHLWLNGLYWGVYNLTERPDERFAADHFGGKPQDYDARNAQNVLSGDEVAWQQLWTLINAGFADASSLEPVQKLLDLPAFIDFMILNLYGANADWDRASNWYAARRRNPPGPFRFFVWDGERTLETVEGTTLEFDDDLSPPRLFHKLRENEEFRMAFADRVQRHLGGRGVLTPGPAGDRLRVWSRQLDVAIVAESARWGDYRRDVHPYKIGPYELYSRDQHWRPEIDRLLRDYFPQRTAVVLRQFQQAGLYPTVATPAAHTQNNRVILSTSNSNGVIYFTEDGTDPRLPGGNLSPRAQRYSETSAPAPGVKWRARVLAQEGSQPRWSAAIEDDAR